MNRSWKRNRIAVLAAVACGALMLLALPSIAAAKDRNHDHIPDGWEKKHKLSLKVNQARRDQDHDHLRNRAEFKAGTNPRDADSDNDGVRDGKENAGTIASFDGETGKLTINLFNGDTISGFVTDGTEIECGCGHHSSGESAEDPTAARSSSEDRGPDSSGDDDVGEHAPGADDGPNHDLGDDHGDHQGEHHGNCSTEDLIGGAAIKEAELKLSGGTADFEKVELGRES